MIEQVQNNIFRVKRHDLNTNRNEIFQELSKRMSRNFSYLVCTRREDARINGMWDQLKGVENDYRSTYLIIVK